MNARQLENGFQAYLRHIRFWEKREGWPHLTDEELREAYDQQCRTAAVRVSEARRRWPPADEIVRGLPTLIAMDMNKRMGKRLIARPIPLKPAPVHKPPVPTFPGSVPLP